MRGLRQPKRTPVHPTFGYNRAPHIKPLPEFGTRHGARRSRQVKALRWQPTPERSIDTQRLFGALANHSPPPSSRVRRSAYRWHNKRTLANPPNPLMIFCTRIWETDQIFAHIENKSADMEKRHDVQARGFWESPRQQAPHASPAQSGVHASAAAGFPPARQEGY